MSIPKNFSFYEKYLSLKTAQESLSQTKEKYTRFIKEMYSAIEAEENLEKLESNIEKLNRKIEVNNLFVVDIVCILLMTLAGVQWSFQELTRAYPIISVALAVFFAGIIFFNIHRNKVRFCILQEELIKNTFNELCNPNKYYERLGIDIITVTLGKDLAWIADTDQNGNLLPRIVGMRKRLVDELGYIIPNVRLLKSFENEPNEFDIWIRGKLVAKSEIIDKPEFLDEADMVVKELQKCAMEYVDYIFSLTNVYKITECVKVKDSALVDYLFEYVDNLDIRNIFVGLIKQNKSIKDVDFIYQKIADYGRTTADTEEITKKIKADIDKLSKASKDLV
ncbi:MAG: flagellar biosynthesis protein FlhA [bacterium]|nr:flagellar biosynthesis protein FlhA [bacterium]